MYLESVSASQRGNDAILTALNSRVMAKINTVQHAYNEHAYNKFTNISNIPLTYGIISCLLPSEVGADESKGKQLPYNVVVC